MSLASARVRVRSRVELLPILADADSEIAECEYRWSGAYAYAANVSSDGLVRGMAPGARETLADLLVAGQTHREQTP